MKAKEKLSIEGRLRLRTYDKDGNLLNDWTGKNMVVNIGLTNLAGLLAGDGTAGFIISGYKAGTNPTAPALADAAITAPFTKVIAGFSYPAANEVDFNFTMELTENNGMNIAEYGMFDSNGRLFSRLTPPPVLKTNALRIVGDWLFSFSN